MPPEKPDKIAEEEEWEAELQTGWSDQEEHDDKPHEPHPLVVYLKEKFELTSRFFLRHRAVALFLRSVKEGNTTEALQCLANNPFLLTFTNFAKDGDTVWHLLAEYGDIMLLQALTNYCKIHNTRGIARSKASDRHTEKETTIRDLVNAGNNLRQTPLMFAAYHGRSDVISFLLDQGANPWAVDRCGKRTALHYACIKGHATCVRALLEGIKERDKQRNGVRYVNVNSASGFTALHFAVASNCVPAASVLLQFDADIDKFNIFDAGEFWISCCTKSTALHIAATSNRLHCAVAILQHYERRVPKGSDPRLWVDKKKQTPYAIATAKGHEEIAALLMPGAPVPKDSNYMDSDVNPVVKLQVLAAKVLQKELLRSIQEAEEFMKLLGTHQQHGRVFARRAYDSEQKDSQQTSTSDALVDPFFREQSEIEPPSLAGPSTSPAPPSNQLSKVLALGGSMSTGILHQQSSHLSQQSLNMHKQSSDANAPRIAQLSERPGSSNPRGTDTPVVGSSNGSMMIAKASLQSTNGGTVASNGIAKLQAPQVKERKAAALKQWLSYERKAAAAGKRPVRRAVMQERSILSQINPDDAESAKCMGSVLACLHLRNEPVYLPPQVGEDVCGLCHDNKPLLQMQACGHRTCLLCAKSLCFLLDLQQLVLCPYCGSPVEGFDLG